VCAIGGFLVGATPFGVILWPIDLNLRSTIKLGGVVTVQDGWPTFAGWMNYGSILLVLGGVGAVSALVFWGVVQVRLTSKRNSDSGV
jgi:hypothetical protein